MKEKELEFDNKINEVLSGVLDNSKPEEQEGLSEDQVNINLEATDEQPSIEEASEQQAEEEPINAADLFKDKYYQEKKKRKTILADRQKLEQENQELRQFLNGTIENNTKLYGQNLYNDLERIRNIKKQALLGDDPDLFLEADELHKKTMMKINEFENLASNSATDKTKQEEPPISTEANIDNRMAEQQLSKAQEWLDDHPELIDGSSHYNPKIQKEVAAFIQELDKDLKKKGRSNEILSDQYLEAIDEFIDSVKIKKPKDGYTTSNVGGVRNNFSNQGSNKIRITLTDFDKQMARELKMSEEQYLKYQYKNRA
jgi:hypothetical protein